ncbi:hypothetical protein NDU88_007026 [Pleurodeles waltl]|uniref:Uncharacterized protein n=1 Tax=Pleurodeles waltl TaxID=8319 RepID=A0AAV7NV20_PLEWA|nr:hypothetical protein NDU88_007026 [Pleurodeles waltl]
MHFTGDFGGGSQAGGDGQRHGFPEGEDKIHALGHSGLSVRSTGARAAGLDSGDTYHLLYGQRSGTSIRSKLIDLEDRSCRDNVHFCGFPETIEGADIHFFLQETLPKLTGLTFDPPLEFQRVHRLGPKRRDDTNLPCPIIRCLLRHVQTHHLLQAARSHCTFQMDGLEIRLTDHFSKETSERWRAFLPVRPRLPQLEVKCGLFELARM